MSIPIECLDEDLRRFAERFRPLVKKPRYQYLVTVVLGLMLYEGTSTLTGLVHHIADGASVAGYIS
jgi:hypothetical protein